MNEPMGTFILDFQTTSFEPDSRIANDLMAELQKACELQNAYALDPPVERAGWSFAKLFLSGQFVERLYSGHAYEIDGAKGKKFPDKFIVWLCSQLRDRGCNAQVKVASEMKEL